MGDRVCDRIGAERQAPDVRRLQAGFADRFVAEAADESLTLGAHRRRSRVDVVLGLRTAREREVTQADRAFDEQGLELITVVHRVSGGGVQIGTI